MRNIIIVLTIAIPFLSFSQQNDAGILLQNPQNIQDVHQNAINFYTLQLNIDSKDVQSLVRRSQIYRSIQMNEEAETDMALALSINPYASLYLNRNERNDFFSKRNYSYLAKYIKAENNAFDKTYLLINEYTSLMSEDSIYYALSGSTLNSVLKAIVHRDFDDARVLLSALNEDEVGSALYFDLKGVIALEYEQVEESISHFTKAIEVNPEFVIPYHNRAIAYKKIGNFEAAKKDFLSALRLRADIAKINFSKGKLLELKGDLSGAEYYYEEALDKSEYYPEAHLNYSVMLKATGKYTEAMIEINNLIKENPEDSNNYYVRGGLYFIYGEYSNAAHDFDTFLSRNPMDSEVLFYKGLCHIMEGDKLQGCNALSDSIAHGYEEKSGVYLYMCE